MRSSNQAPSLSAHRGRDARRRRPARRRSERGPRRPRPGEGARHRALHRAAQPRPAQHGQPGTLIRELANICMSRSSTSGRRSAPTSSDGHLLDRVPTMALAYTFKLRKGVKSPTVPTSTPRPCRVNYDRAMNVKRGPYAVVKQIKTVEVVDEGTVRLRRVHKPSAAFVDAAAVHDGEPGRAAAKRRHRLRAGNWFNAAQTAGTGAYKLDRWQRGSVVLRPGEERTPAPRSFRPDNFDLGRNDAHHPRPGRRQPAAAAGAGADRYRADHLDRRAAGAQRNPRIQWSRYGVRRTVYLLLSIALPPLNGTRACARRSPTPGTIDDKHKAPRKGIAPRADGPAPNVTPGEGLYPGQRLPVRPGAGAQAPGGGGGQAGDHADGARAEGRRAVRAWSPRCSATS